MVKHSFQNIHKFLKTSYATEKKPEIPEGYKKDDSLSGRRVQVYVNHRGKAIVVHRGTEGLPDVWSDVKFSLGYKKSKRFKHASKIQNEAEKKYGADRITTMGHSLGGAIAENVGQHSRKIITYNKAVGLGDIGKRIRSHQTDIRTKNDLVSFLRKTQKGGTLITLKSETKDPLKEHSIQRLEGLQGKV